MTDRVSPSRLPRVRLGVAVVGVLVAALFASPGPHARADTAPTAVPRTVAANALPTVQENGVVWSQVVVGDEVYATGRFSEIYPAGQAPTASNTTPRENLLAYSISTGLPYRFDHSLNAQGLVLAASPDGSVVYVGGDFTTVDGRPRYRLAAFDQRTGGLISSFHPTVNGQVRSIYATSRSVFIGGSFTSVDGQPRTRLAKLSPGTGQLWSWAPSADAVVTAMVLTPDGTGLVVGGNFTTLDGAADPAMGSLDPVTGRTRPWAINATIRDAAANSQCGITTLATDGTSIYGGGYNYGCPASSALFEGTFAADPDTGDVEWINDCHGDTYGVFPIGKVVYSVSHAHDCSPIGAFPDQSAGYWHRALATTTWASSGTDSGPDVYGWNYSGIHDARLLQWYPTLVAGTVTHQDQAAWSITGNADYVVLGGEFPTVNGYRQAGLARFAVPDLSSNSRGPFGASTLTPTLTQASATSFTISWLATWDQDNAVLRYRVYRDGSQNPVCDLTRASNFWTLPAMSCTDTGLGPGTTHSYVVRVTDAWQNAATSRAATATLG